MRQWNIGPGGTSVADLVLSDISVPPPGPGQVRVRVGAVSMNARDRMILAGPFGRLPDRSVTPLSDVSGVIDELGPDVTGWHVGNRVMTAHVPEWEDGAPVPFGIGPGSLDDPGVGAEYILVDAGRLIATPAYLSDLEASTLQVAGVTAWNALFGAHPVEPDDTVVVIGSGGVSLYAAQLARAAGARVVAAVRGGRDTDERWSIVSPVLTVTTDEPGWGMRISEATGGAAKVVDTVGGRLIGESLATLRGGGEVAVPGLVDMSPVEVNILAMIGAQTSIRGVAVGSVQMHRELAAFMSEHEIHPVIDTAVDFDHLPDAYSALNNPRLFGKIVLQVGAEAS